MENSPKLDTVLEFLNYDAESGKFTWKRNPCRKYKNRVNAGVVGVNGYVHIGFLNKSYYAHRLAWLIFYGKHPISEIDHINGNRSDNRIANLRAATSSQNCHNQRKKKSSTGLKGVYKSSIGSRFHGKVCKNKIVHYAGTFDSLEEADLAVRSLRNQLHGEFTNHGSVAP